MVYELIFIFNYEGLFFIFSLCRLFLASDIASSAHNQQYALKRLLSERTNLYLSFYLMACEPQNAKCFNILEKVRLGFNRLLDVY